MMLSYYNGRIQPKGKYLIILSVRNLGEKRANEIYEVMKKNGYTDWVEAEDTATRDNACVVPRSDYK